MKILEVPFTHQDMRYSISLTGITILHEGKYKQRHNTTKEIVQVPKKGFMTKANYQSTQTTKQIKPTRRKKKQSVVTKSNDKATQVRQYRIDKTEVSHRIRNYINQMKGEKMLYFWTITFPQHTTDDTAYILLNKWLTRLRTENMIKEYLWITERQENGTIHFHMVINRKMDVRKANRYMRASIMYSINKQEIQYDRIQTTRYNGVDIAKDRKTKRVINFAKQHKQKALSNYLTKYVTKNNSTFQHLAWHSSREYSNLITNIRFTSIEITGSGILQQINKDNPLDTKYFTFYRWKDKVPKEITEYMASINQHILSLLNIN